MTHDQTAPFNLGLYCLPYKLPKSISRREEQMSKVMNGGLKG